MSGARRRPGLRLRAAVGFAVVSLVATTCMGVLTYQFARRYLVAQRDALAIRQAVVNATVARSVLEAPEPDVGSLVVSLSGSGSSRPLVQVGDAWYSGAVELDPSQLPDDLVALVDAGTPATRRMAMGGSTLLMVGIPLPAVDAAYYEVTVMRELPRTLRVIELSLLAAALLATAAAAGVGWWASGRVVRPLTRVSATAAAVREGRHVRMEPSDDPDMARIATSFNAMVDELEERIARERRFTADVSHELRTPVTAISSAVHLARRSDLTPRAATALTLLEGQADHLRRLVMDLLEISRFDAASMTLEPDAVDPVAAARAVMATCGADPSLVDGRGMTASTVMLDRRRVERVLVNLVENAKRYAGGVTALRLGRDGPWLRIAVEDHGPGVAPDERQAIFGRFHRGGAAADPDAPKGTGLGLALVDEHVRLHGGQVWVEDNHGGGARFVVLLPWQEAGL